MISPFTDLVDEEHITSSFETEEGTHILAVGDLEQNYFGSSKSLKGLLRKFSLPVNHPIRRNLWPHVINNFYGTSIHIPGAEVASPPSEDETPTPSPMRQSLLVGYELADRRLQTTYHLNARGRAIHLSLLHEVSVSRPQLVYAPQAFPLLAALLHYLRPPVALACLLALLDASNAAPAMVVQTKADWRARCLALEQLGVEGFSKKAFKRFREEARGEEKRNQLAVWPCALWHLPFECLVPIIDCYLVEGPKVLFRVGLVLWKRASKAMGVASDVATGAPTLDLAVLLQQTASSWSPDDSRVLLKTAFKIRRLSRRHIDRAIERAAGICQGVNSGLDIVDSLVVPCVLPGQRTYTAYGHVKAEFAAKAVAARSSLRAIGKTSTPHRTPSNLATPEEILHIIEAIADDTLAQLCTPVVIFSSERDGISLSTLFKRCKTHTKASGHPETILLVQTASGQGLVGAFCSQSWVPGTEWSFYGNGKSFLFRLRPTPTALYKWVKSEAESPESGGDGDGGGGSPEKFQRSTTSFIEVGGGLDSGPAGLRLDANLKMGESGSSPTFGSDCLITSESDKVYAATVNDKAFCSFKISTVEVLGFVSA